MTVGRKTAWFLVAMAAWNFFTWITFARNLHDAHSSGEDRPQGYWIAHTGLIVVNLVLGVVFAVLGVRALRLSDRGAGRRAGPS
jgi:putative solute:sodium symporter small subunit